MSARLLTNINLGVQADGNETVSAGLIKYIVPDRLDAESQLAKSKIALKEEAFCSMCVAVNVRSS